MGNWPPILDTQVLTALRDGRKVPVQVSWFLASSVGPQVIIICLVVLDALLVLAELVLDLKIIEPDKNNYAPKVVCPQPFNMVHSCYLH